MFAIFKKKSNSVDDLLAAYQDHQATLDEIENDKNRIKDAAIRAGDPDLDAVAADLSKLDVKAELHQRARAEIRSRLENLIRQQLTDARAEIERRRPALEAEIHDQYRQCGQLFQQLVDLLQVLPEAFSGVYRNLQESIDSQLKRQAGKPAAEAFAAGMQSAQSTEHDYRAEWQAVQLPVNANDPGGLERKLQKVVARLLGEAKPNYQSSCFGLGPR